MLNYGFGVIIGSGIFDYTLCFGIGAIVSFSIHKKALSYEIYPLLRDYIFYILSLIYVIFVTRGRTINLWESSILLFLFPIYLIFSIYTDGKKVEFESSNTSMEAKADNDEENDLFMNQDQLEKDIEKLNSELDELNNDMEGFYKEIKQEEIKKKSILELDPDDNEKELIDYSEYTFFKVYQVINAPWRYLFKLTIFPERWPIIAFLVILIYVFLITEFTVSYVEMIASRINISHAFIGLTITSLGANVLDVVNFIVAAKAKRLELATTSLIGSQIINLHLALGIPWVIKTSMEGDLLLTEIAIEYSLMVSLAITIISLIIIATFRFKLENFSGILLILLYFVYFGIQLNELVLKPIKANGKNN